mmetsp:Transcript_6180/g.8371  ORF Transcript_6180/g.8371 Transcript_6180/m.8371 type:complete len:137 (+) Transcript_6180:331-741(+)
MFLVQVALMDDIESLLFEVRAQKEAVPGWVTSGVTKPETLGANKLKVLGLPEGGSIVYTTTLDGNPSVTAIVPKSGQTADLRRRPSINTYPDHGKAEIDIPLLLQDTEVPISEKVCYVDKGSKLRVSCTIKWTQHA